MFSLLLTLVITCNSLSIKYKQDPPNIVTKTKIELLPIYIYCKIHNIAIISAPSANCKEHLYHLHKPNGEIVQPDFSKPKAKKKAINTTEYLPNSFDYDKIIVKYINRDVKAIYPNNKYKVINANFAKVLKDNNIVEETESEMMENDFMLGPLTEEDHGNWVLSLYCTDIDDGWVEIFQVITIQIIEIVPMIPWKPKLKEGSTFHLSFAYPIKDLQSCELIAPRSTYDRYFDRNRIELPTCGYVVPNITKSDEGRWKIIGVGKIVYRGYVDLSVDSKILDVHYIPSF